MCNKVDFESKSEAKKEIQNLRAVAKFRNKNKFKTEDKTKKLKPYRCNVCEFWHLTSLSINVTRRFRGGTRK